ncbi:MAG TPA: hypothetical protein VJU78_04500, partial [Chitinophagaceae bacterium]|nr:hypothetical protein [Chitinophagaceae bacterium]
MFRLFSSRPRCSTVFSLFLFILSILSDRTAAQCSVTGARSGSAFSNNTSIGSFAWSGTGNLIFSDNTRAGNGILLGGLGASASTNYIIAQNFGFTIPSGAAVCGIEVTIERRATGLLIGSSIRDNSIRLIKNNVISGSDLASAVNWPGSDGSRVYGSVSETWGTAWTPADINAANFGVAISATLSAGLASLFLTAEIDRVSVRVFYNLVLPVQLISFKAIQQEDKINLEWSTASENNNHHFTVERSVDGTTAWNVIDSVAGSGKTNSLRYYRATDNKPLPVNYYRLKQTDNDGHETFSSIVSVRVNEANPGLRMYPNPVSNSDAVIALFPGKTKRILIKNIIGKEVEIKTFVAISGGVRIKLPDLED